MSLCMVGAFGVVGLVGVIGLTRIAQSVGFRPQWQVITHRQQGCTDRQVTGDLERATPTNGSILSHGEGKTGVGRIAIQTQAIERPKASLEEVDQLLQEKKALKFKVARLHHLLEEKTTALSSAEEAETSKGKIYELETKITIQTEEIERLQAELEKQDQLIQEKTAKLSVLEHAAEQRDAEKDKKIARLESEVAHLNCILEENTTNQRQREEIRQMKTAPRTSTDGEQISMLLPPIIFNKAESISVAEVAELVKILNAQIEQGSSLITDSLFNRESLSIGQELEILWDELNDFIGSWLCNDLKRRLKVEPDPLITQITLQTGLVNACSRIINDSNPPFWIDDLIFSRVFSSVEKTNGQATADAQGALLRSHMSVLPSDRQEANKRYLTKVLLRLITAVGGSLENGILPPHYNEVLEDIVKTSLELHRVVREDLVPMMELVTETIPCDAEFDPSRMVDTEGDESKTGSGRVVCTVEMGLRCKKRDELRKKNGSSEECGMTMKSKVVLATTLEDY
ncbi:hypothetical protein M378DRAFT_173390 [Amanita muscaria Koide BX008]|uniref:Uncharacterized protein n=1 Tax=Amanita muscaria (strain Koide BX008) TaxID=946122 RepID=A0A0C2W3P7_AMAMK|nr:hypothetical protein M378DRAFT_173390 [Amanita muscaria Koide BX008]